MMYTRRLPAFKRKSLSKANKILFIRSPQSYGAMLANEKHYKFHKAAIAVSTK